MPALFFAVAALDLAVAMAAQKAVLRAPFARDTLTAMAAAAAIDAALTGVARAHFLGDRVLAIAATLRSVALALVAPGPLALAAHIARRAEVISAR